MMTAKETEVLTGDAKPWALMPNHIHLYHREILSAEQADAMGIQASSILWERIDVGGQVLPHYHDVAEIIHITMGKVKLLCNEEWKSFKAGDTFHVPAGVIHSVANDDDQPTEQISIFLPVDQGAAQNSFFNTSLVEDVYSIKMK
jgi:mannose-6-phosphate isomerase-like protein (cupin superfamily)